MSILKITSPPQDNPVTLSEAKLFCRVTITQEDSLLASLVTAASDKWNKESAYILAETEYQYTTDAATEVVLPVRPVSVVSSVNSLVLDTDYTVEIDPQGICTLKILADVTDDLVITFLAGFASGEEPELPKLAIKTLVAHWYRNREAFADGTGFKTVPQTYHSIVQSHRLA